MKLKAALSLAVFSTFTIASLGYAQFAKPIAAHLINNYVENYPDTTVSGQSLRNQLIPAEGPGADYNNDGVNDVLLLVRYASIVRLDLISGQSGQRLAQTQVFTDNHKEIKHFAALNSNGVTWQPYVLWGNQVYRVTLTGALLNLGSPVMTLSHKPNKAPALDFGISNAIKRVPAGFVMAAGTPGLPGGPVSAGTKGRADVYNVTDSELASIASGANIKKGPAVTKIGGVGDYFGQQVVFMPSGDLAVTSRKKHQGPNGVVFVNSPWVIGDATIYSSNGVFKRTIVGGPIASAYPYDPGTMSFLRVIAGRDHVGRSILAFSGGKQRIVTSVDTDTGQTVGITPIPVPATLSFSYSEFEFTKLSKLQDGVDYFSLADLVNSTERFYRIDGVMATKVSSSSPNDPYQVGLPGALTYQGTGTRLVSIKRNANLSTVQLAKNYADERALDLYPAPFLVNPPILLGQSGELPGSFAILGLGNVTNGAQVPQIGDVMITFYAPTFTPFAYTNANGQQFNLGVSPLLGTYQVKTVTAPQSLAPGISQTWATGGPTQPNYVADTGTQAFVTVVQLDKISRDLVGVWNFELHHGRNESAASQSVN